ncbi:MAG: hypothetical protein KatS3mg029_0656 [Saprospiraceae bacterium]|nr:MAG: hypothetical protein KatS3mg029_0656 [Saprospiraceae bacterium]
MFTEKHFPQSLTGDELDLFLEAGWYRMGQSIFTCHFIFFEENLYSAIWIRLPLEGYTFRKSARKLMRKVENRFQVVVRPAVIDEQKELLFQHFKLFFKGNLYGTLHELMFDHKSYNIFDTWEVAVYDADRLAGFSFFDLGHHALASIKAVYHNDYRQYSLGIYTMLREIQFGWEQGFNYYYPGYVVPGFQRFDYKLRIGSPDQVQFFEIRENVWKPWSTFDPEQVPARVLDLELFKMGFHLSLHRIGFQLVYYPAFESNLFGTEKRHFLQSPIFLHLFSDRYLHPRFAISYDLRAEEFVFSHSIPPTLLRGILDRYDTLANPHLPILHQLLADVVILRHWDAQAIVQRVLQINDLLKHFPQL